MRPCVQSTLRTVRMIRAEIKVTKIVIPTEAELSDRLAGIERLMTAKGWERAAIVWAFTTDGRHGARTDLDSVGKPAEFPVSPTEFARLGFHGLRDRENVANYRKAWTDAIA